MPKIQIILGLVVTLIIGGIFISNFKKSGTLLTSEKMVFEGNQKVSESSSLRMSFIDEMDAESLQENMETPIGGEAIWEGKTLVFTPDEKLEEDETYTFTVNRNAKYANGKPVNKDLTYRFTVAGAPVLSSHYPSKDAKGIDPKSKIHLIFDRPVIPLSAVQGSGAKKYQGKWPVTITPSLKGNWRWLGTSTVEFTPAEAMKPGTSYTVKVPSGIKMINGDVSKEDFSWSFETIRPKVISTEPRNNYELNGPETELMLTFNQEMDPGRAKRNIELRALNENSEITRLSFNVEQGYDELEERKEMNKNKLLITPSKPLELKKSYALAIKEGILGAEGSLGSATDFVLNFKTVSDFEVEEYNFEYSRLYINFNNPVNNETLEGNLSIEPEIEGWEDIELTTSEWSDNQDLYIYGSFEPSTEYRVTLNNKVLDRFNQRLNEPLSYEFTTPPHDPYVGIISNGEFGIFEKEIAPVYPFEVVNVSKIDIEMARLPFDRFLEIRKQQKKNWRFETGLAELHRLQVT